VRDPRDQPDPADSGPGAVPDERPIPAGTAPTGADRPCVVRTVRHARAGSSNRGAAAHRGGTVQRPCRIACRAGSAGVTAVPQPLDLDTTAALLSLGFVQTALLAAAVLGLVAGLLGPLIV